MPQDPTRRGLNRGSGPSFAPTRSGARGPQADPDPPRVLVCVNHRLNARQPSCGARGSEALRQIIEALAGARGLDDAIEAIRCLGHCENGPAMRIAPGGAFFDTVTKETLPAILDALEAARNKRD